MTGQPAMTLHVATVEEAKSSEFVAEYIHRGRPVIIEFGDSECDRSLDEFTSLIGSEGRAVRVYGEERIRSNRDQWDGYCDFVQLNPAEYATWIRDGTAKRRHAYMAQVDLTGTALETRVSMWTQGFLDALFPSAISGFNYWLGPGGHVEPLHYDPADGVLLQLSGAKKIRLVPPQFSRALYPFPVLSRIRPWFSRVELSRPDFESFPRAREAVDAMTEIDLQAGQGLYIPAGWWHEVSSLGDDWTCSVNRFFAVRPLRRLLAVHRGVPLYAAMTNRKIVVAIEGVFRKRGAARS